MKIRNMILMTTLMTAMMTAMMLTFATVSPAQEVPGAAFKAACEKQYGECSMQITSREDLAQCAQQYRSCANYCAAHGGDSAISAVQIPAWLTK